MVLQDQLACFTLSSSNHSRTALCEYTEERTVNNEFSQSQLRENESEHKKNGVSRKLRMVNIPFYGEWTRNYESRSDTD